MGDGKGKVMIPRKKRRCRFSVQERSNERLHRLLRALKARLVKVDLADINEPCILLITEAPEDKPLVWFPDKQLVGMLTDSVLTPDYIPLSSSSGLICGMHEDNIFDYGECRDMDGWTIRLMVSNPSTGFQMKLPPFEIMKHYLSSAHSHMCGELEVFIKSAPPDNRSKQQQQFTVYLVTRYADSRGRVYDVYTFDSVSGTWETNSNCGSNETFTNHLAGDIWFLERTLQGYDVETKSWSALPVPARNGFPLPPGFDDLSYSRLDPFRYGSRIMAAGQCERPCGWEGEGFVVLELERWSSTWKVVAWFRHFHTFHATVRRLPRPDYMNIKPLVGGGFLVFPMTGYTAHPLVFHLDYGTWLEVPQNLYLLQLQSTCVYNP